MNNVKEEILFSHTLPSAIIEGMKRCSKCGEKKLLTAFNIDQGKKDGRQSYCRLCQEDDRLLRAYNLTRQQRDLMYDRLKRTPSSRQKRAIIKIVCYTDEPK